MSFQNVSRIFVIGATGAQGLPVVRGLVGDGKYSVLALTRDANSARAVSRNFTDRRNGNASPAQIT